MCECLDCEQDIFTAPPLEEAKQRIPPEFRGNSFFSAFDLYQYIAITDDRTCKLCMQFDKMIISGSFIRAYYPYLEIISPNQMLPHVHPNCVLNGTLVATENGLRNISEIKVGDLVLTHTGQYKPVIQVHKNQVDSEIVKINDCWLTTNHPILVSHNKSLVWKMAGDCNERDSIIMVKSSEFPSSKIKSYQSPPVSFKRTILSVIDWSFLSTRMPLAAVYFNSNQSFGNSQINIENIKSILRNNGNIRLIKSFHNNNFVFIGNRIKLFLGGSFYKFVVRTFNTFNSIMARFNLTSPLFRSHFRPFQSFGLALRTTGNAFFEQSAGNTRTRNFEAFSDFILGKLFIKIKSDNFLVTNSFSHTSAPITNIYKEAYKGLVYNLSVAQDESYCIGKKKMVVHNCRCTLLRVTDLADYITYTEPLPDFPSVKYKEPNIL